MPRDHFTESPLDNNLLYVVMHHTYVNAKYAMPTIRFESVSFDFLACILIDYM